MLFEGEERAEPGGGRISQARGVVGGLVVGNQEIWVVVAGRGDEQVLDWLRPDPGAEELAPLRVCRALRDGVVVLGEPDPEQDRLLSDRQ